MYTLSVESVLLLTNHTTNYITDYIFDKLHNSKYINQVLMVAYSEISKYDILMVVCHNFNPCILFVPSTELYAASDVHVSIPKYLIVLASP